MFFLLLQLFHGHIFAFSFKSQPSFGFGVSGGDEGLYLLGARLSHVEIWLNSSLGRSGYQREGENKEEKKTTKRWGDWTWSEVERNETLDVARSTQVIGAPALRYVMRPARTRT